MSRSIDARGAVTLFEYDENGQTISRTEAFGTDLERTAIWVYDEDPRLATGMKQPSTTGSGLRRS